MAQREARERLRARQQQVETLKEVLRLAKLRLTNGVASQLDVLDAQRNLLSAQLSWVGAWQQPPVTLRFAACDALRDRAKTGRPSA